jgi:hypothetical protein
MTIETYRNIGMVLFWLGVATCIGSIVLFLAASRGVQIDGPDKLNLHDTYYLVLSLGHRLSLLFPFIAGLLLLLTGLIVRSQTPLNAADFTKTEEAEQDVQGNTH